MTTRRGLLTRAAAALALPVVAKIPAVEAAAPEAILPQVITAPPGWIAAAHLPAHTHSLGAHTHSWCPHHHHGGLSCQHCRPRQPWITTGTVGDA